MNDLDDNVELHGWICDACIRGDHARCAADFGCECDHDSHEEPPAKCPKCGGRPSERDIKEGKITLANWMAKHPCGYQGPDDGSDV